MSKRDPLLVAHMRNVRQRRDTRELTQEKLAKALGLTATELWWSENGTAAPVMVVESVVHALLRWDNG